MKGRYREPGFEADVDHLKTEVKLRGQIVDLKAENDMLWAENRKQRRITEKVNAERKRLEAVLTDIETKGHSTHHAFGYTLANIAGEALNEACKSCGETEYHKGSCADQNALLGHPYGKHPVGDIAQPQHTDDCIGVSIRGNKVYCLGCDMFLQDVSEDGDE